MYRKMSMRAATMATLTLVASGLYQTAFATHAAIQVQLNEQPLATSVPPLTQNGRTLVPMRDIFEALGANVHWNELTQSITAQRGTTTVNMQIGQRTALINSERVSLDQPAILHDGRTMVPLRFVSQALGAQVNWNSQNRLVSISTTGTAGQTGQTGETVAGSRTIIVPAGAVVPVKLDDSLSSAKARVGQTFTTTVVSEKPGDSEFPPDTKIEGVVTEVRKKTATSPGVLDVDFRAVIFPNGERQSLQGQLTALDSDNVTRQSEGRLVAKKSSNRSEKFKIIGIGAGAGYLIGKVLLKKSGLWSAVLGAAGGYLYSQHKDKKNDAKPAEAVLPEGTKLGVRIDRRLVYADTTGYADQRASYVR